MPEITCRKCGHLSNTAVSNHIESTDSMADGCYARFVDGKWETGCSYEEALPFQQSFVDRLLLVEVEG